MKPTIAEHKNPPRNRLFDLDANLQTDVYVYLFGAAAVHTALAAPHRPRDQPRDTLYWTLQYSLAIAPLACASDNVKPKPILKLHVPNVRTPLQCCEFCFVRVVFANVDREFAEVFCSDLCADEFYDAEDDWFNRNRRSNDDEEEFFGWSYYGRGGYDNDF